MSVEYQGTVVFIKLASGRRADRAAVEQIIKRLFAIPSTQELNVSFECLVRNSDEKVELEGSGAFSAALHCAWMAAHRHALEKGEGPESAGGTDDGVKYVSVHSLPL